MAAASSSIQAPLHSTTVKCIPTLLMIQRDGMEIVSRNMEDAMEGAVVSSSIQALSHSTDVRYAPTQQIGAAESLSVQAQSHSSYLKYAPTLLGGVGPMLMSQEESPPAPSTRSSPASLA